MPKDKELEKADVEEGNEKVKEVGTYEDKGRDSFGTRSNRRSKHHRNVRKQ